MRSHPSTRASSRPRTVLAASALALLPLLAACGDGDDAGKASAATGAPAAPGGGIATVTFTSPADGARIAGAVDLRMVADGVVIEEAGEVREGAGHLHVMTAGQCVSEGEAIPKDADHVHFGKGQLEDQIFLRAGTHELCLQVGDGAHVAQPITETLTVTVGVETREEWCEVSNLIDDIAPEPDDADATIEDLHASAAKVTALADQLQDRVDLVSDVARDDVAAMIDHFLGLTTAISGAPDVASVAERSQEFYDDVPQAVIDGSNWVDSNCKAS